ncbi:MAG: DUF3426 domain-containing protein [Minwuia sp.]|uniref:DUF3426 domain-containing protein n=1 Tax=Minwuia sp. TaxID=2493630 RepID=UPI003A87DFBC
MFLTCPSCAAKFRVRPEMFEAGPRKVRCSRCGHQWVGEPDLEPVEPAPEPQGFDPEPEPAEAGFSGTIPGQPADWEDMIRAERDPDPDDAWNGDAFPLSAEARSLGGRPAGRKTPSWVWAGWALIAAVLVVTALGLAFLKPVLVAAWPPVERLYHVAGAAGLSNAGPAVSYRIERSSLTESEGRRRMEIRLTATNATDKPQALPIAAIDLIDQSGEVIRTVPVRMPGEEKPLEAHESREVPLVLDDVPKRLDRVRASVWQGE